MREGVTTVESAVYGGLYRPLWSARIVWLVYMCAAGRAGEFNPDEQENFSQIHDRMRPVCYGGSQERIRKKRRCLFALIKPEYNGIYSRNDSLAAQSSTFRGPQPSIILLLPDAAACSSPETFCKPAPGNVQSLPNSEFSGIQSD